MVNGIHDRIAGKWFTWLASANGIRDRIAGKWITGLNLTRSPSLCK
jgi:hypothetical protein